MAEETRGTLDKVLEAIQGYKQKKQAGSGGWIAAVITGVLALIAIAVFAWQAWKAGKERAKLLHEKAVREEEEHQARVDADLAEDQATKDSALQVADELQKEVDRLQEEADHLEAERVRARETIERISSWEDVDEIVR